MRKQIKKRSSHQSLLNSTRIKSQMKALDVKSALRNGRSSARIRVQLMGEAALKFQALLDATGISSEAAASSLLSAVLLENPEVTRLIDKESGRDHDLHHMAFAQLRDSYRKHLITKESLEAYLADLSKTYSGSLGMIAKKAFHLKDDRAKKSFYAWIRFLRTAHGFRLP